MEIGTDGPVIELRTCFAAARRLRDGARKHPMASRGLIKSAGHYIGRAATLAGEICSGAGRQDQAPDAFQRPA